MLFESMKFVLTKFVAEQLTSGFTNLAKNYSLTPRLYPQCQCHTNGRMPYPALSA